MHLRAIFTLGGKYIHNSPYECLACGRYAPDFYSGEACGLSGCGIGVVAKYVRFAALSRPVAARISVHSSVVLCAELYRAVARCERAFLKKLGCYLVVVYLNLFRSVGALVVESPSEYIETIAKVVDSNLVVVVGIASSRMFGGIAESAFASGLPLAGDIVDGLFDGELYRTVAGARRSSSGEAFVGNLVANDVHIHLVIAALILRGCESPLDNVVTVLKIPDSGGRFIGSGGKRGSVGCAKTCARNAASNCPLSCVAISASHYAQTADVVGRSAGGYIALADLGDRLGILYGSCCSSLACIVVLYINCPSYLLGSTSLNARYCGSGSIAGSECKSVGSVFPFAALSGCKSRC